MGLDDIERPYCLDTRFPPLWQKWDDARHKIARPHPSRKKELIIRRFHEEIDEIKREWLRKHKPTIRRYL